MNPFVAKLEKAKIQLDRVRRKQKQFDSNAIPGTYVTGNSGVPASRRRKLDAQLDRTIDLSKIVIAAEANVATLERKVKLFDEGKINRQGRAISATPRPPARPLIFRRALIQKAKVQLNLYGEYVTPNGIVVRILSLADGDPDDRIQVEEHGEILLSEVIGDSLQKQLIPILDCVAEREEAHGQP